VTSQASPIAPRERLFELDAIRGVALLGIYIMNMPAFASSFYSTSRVDRWPAWWDRGADWLGNTLFSGKFNSMFSLLFAVGFTILLERLEEQAPGRAKRIYLRRLGVLFAFGAIHACVFWTGDVLHLYALLGLVLLPLRRLRERWLWVGFALCLSFPVALGVYALLTQTPADIARQVEFMRLLEASNDAAYGKGSFIEAAREHTREMIASYSNAGALRRLSTFLAQLGATLVLGLILGRRRFFQRAREQLEVLARAQRWLLGIGLCTAAVYGVRAASVHGPSLPTAFGLLANTCYNLSRVAVMGFYVVTIVRAANSERWRPWLEPIATAGRMPLTNYLMQTLIATFIFYGWGLGFWGRGGPALQLGLAIAIFFLIQVPYSRLWLRHFPMGPMERLWRRLSYGRAAPSQKPLAGEMSASG
jgi:uncharacterized protein